MPSGAVSSVQVESSTWIAWGRSPCEAVGTCQRIGSPSHLGHRGGGKGGQAYAYDGRLALHAGRYLLLLDIDDQVLALVVARDTGDGDVDVTDRLCPLVGESLLFGLLLCAGGCLLGGGGFCAQGGPSVKVWLDVEARV